MRPRIAFEILAWNSHCNPAQVASGGARNRCFRIRENVRFPPRAVDLFESERLDFFEDAINRRWPEGNQVGIAAHECDVPPILHDLDDVAREQCAPTVRAGWPV